eukprot:127047_1
MTRHHCNDINISMVNMLITHQLSKIDSSYKSTVSITDYGDQVIDTYFKNKTNVKLCCLQLNGYHALTEIIVHNNPSADCQESTVSVNLITIVQLFPHIIEISIKEMQEFDSIGLDELIKYYDTNSKSLVSTESTLKKIYFEIKNIYFQYNLIKQYKHKMKRYDIEFVADHTEVHYAKSTETKWTYQSGIDDDEDTKYTT